MRAVPNLKAVLSLGIEGSTSTGALQSLAVLGLSLKVSFLRCLPVFSHRWTVCLLFPKNSANVVTVKFALASFLKTSLMSGDSITPSRDNRLCFNWGIRA
jgi:hypothetical protein